MACYLGIVVIAASIRRELGDDELILRRHRAISSSRGAITDVAGRRDAAIAVAGVGDEEAAIGGELGVERNAHQTQHPIGEVKEQQAVVIDLQGASGSASCRDRRQQDLAFLGGQEDPGRAIRVRGHAVVGARANSLEARNFFLQ